MAGQDWTRVKVVGKRDRPGRPFGFDDIRAFLAMLQEVRAFDSVHPKGVYRFASLKEAQDWWEETRVVLPRATRGSRT